MDGIKNEKIKCKFNMVCMSGDGEWLQELTDSLSIMSPWTWVHVPSDLNSDLDPMDTDSSLGIPSKVPFKVLCQHVSAKVMYQTPVSV